ncbi:MAG TPA: excinuclease ABC subunit C [Clostridiales bacterium]|nr:excinuclease ABC subunit C [Clostridiales bacterium]
MFALESELAKLPAKPGVYLMKDKTGRIIYVGKARALKNRVRQYFQKGSSLSPKTRAMVEHIFSFETITTDNELEALILECNLIKKHRPRYNIMLRDDKTYPYIKVTLGEDFPRVLFTRTVEKDAARYFGPYPSAGAVRETLDMLAGIFPVRSCARNLPGESGKTRPCLRKHLDLCAAPCTGTISVESYGQLVRDLVRFLEGRQHQVIKGLTAEMNRASKALEFEKAGQIRDKILLLNKILEKQKVISPRLKDCDAVVIACGTEDCIAQVYTIRDGYLTGRESHVLEGVAGPEEETASGTQELAGPGADAARSGEAALMASFLERYYEPAAQIPPKLLVSVLPEGLDILEAWLSGKHGATVRIRLPARGYEQELIRMLTDNAKQDMSRREQEEGGRQRKKREALARLADWMGLKEIPGLIEAFDISNTGREDAAASLVVFEDGKPSPRRYRLYKIKTVEGQDDYAGMREVLTRRYGGIVHEGLPAKTPILPDLILVDGGLAHANTASSVLAGLGLAIPAVGMVKDEDHKTRGLAIQGTVIPVGGDPELMLLISEIQEEAHRFALKYSRKLRSKRQVHSILDDIPGIAATRRTALLREFGSIRKMSQASLEQLTKVVGKTAAKAVYERLHINRPGPP